MLNWQESVENKGFAIISQALGREDLRVVLEEFSCNVLHRSRAGVRHAMKLPAVSALARAPRLLGMAQEILGKGAVPFRATPFDKSASGNWLVGWHQDTAMPLRARADVPGWGPWSVKDGVTYAHAPAEALSRVLALRIHLDDSKAENGPVRVLPGTHTRGVLTDDAIHELSTSLATTTCLVERGGVLAMRPLIVHASSKSQTSSPPRVLHIEYAAERRIASGLELEVG